MKTAFRYSPTKDEEEKLSKTVRAIQKTVKSLTLPWYATTIVDVGSTAKGTWLPNESDIDMYVYSDFPERVYEKVSSTLKGRQKKGRLLIWNFEYNGFDVDLIFAKPSDYKREDTAKHTDYFRANLTPKMRREVRKAKALFKTHGVYGAEIGGIVGVAIEELIVEMKSLKGLCKMILAPVKPWIQDPTMTTKRDLLACITPRRWQQLQRVCKDFLDDKIELTLKPMTIDGFEEKYKGYGKIYFPRKFDKGADFYNAYGTVQKCLRVLKQDIPEAKADIDIYLDSEVIVIVHDITPQTLFSATRCMDPTKGDEKAFRKAHPDAFMREGLLCATVERKGLLSFPEEYFKSIVAKEMKERGY